MFTPPLGLAFPIKKTVRFSTTTKTPQSGRGQIRYPNQEYPTWTVEFTFNYLKGNEQILESGVASLVGFYIASKGPYESWLYEDVNDHRVQGCYFGVGDGVRTTFQLVRQIGIGTDIVQSVDVNSPFTVTVNGGPANSYIIGATGIVTFAQPPSAGALLSWSGSYFYRMHFTDDQLSYDQLMQDLFDTGGATVKAESLLLPDGATTG